MTGLSNVADRPKRRPEHPPSQDRRAQRPRRLPAHPQEQHDDDRADHQAREDEVARGGVVDACVGVADEHEEREAEHHHERTQH
jgi:hypothetical protein